jgi:two-component system cell cycle sensor histidine kinase/response regulator CckA
MVGGQSREPALSASGDAPSAEITVLVVDDESVIRAWIARALGRFGIETVLAADGRQARRLITDGLIRPQVLLTDLEMPLMGGVELAARIHALRPGIRIVMMTGDAGRAAAARDRSTIVAAVLEKPILIADLVAAVRPEPKGVAP